MTKLLEFYTRLVTWFGLREPYAVRHSRKLEMAVRQRKAACIRLDRAIRDVGLSAQKHK